MSASALWYHVIVPGACCSILPWTAQEPLAREVLAPCAMNGRPPAPPLIKFFFVTQVRSSALIEGSHNSISESLSLYIKVNKIRINHVKKEAGICSCQILTGTLPARQSEQVCLFRPTRATLCYVRSSEYIDTSHSGPGKTSWPLSRIHSGATRTQLLILRPATDW